MALGHEPKLVAMNDGKIQRVIRLSRHLKHLLVTEVHHDGAGGSGWPMPNRLGQLNDVDLLDFLLHAHLFQSRASAARIGVEEELLAH
jgi:hypothetical protein